MADTSWLLNQGGTPQVDFGQIFAQAEKIKNAKLQNRLASMQLKEAENERQNKQLMQNFLQSQTQQGQQGQQGQPQNQLQPRPQQPMMQPGQMPQGPQPNPMMQRPQGLPPMQGQQQQPQQQPSPWQSPQYQAWASQDPQGAQAYQKSVTDPDLPDKPTKEQLYTIATTSPNPILKKKAMEVIKAVQADEQKSVNDFGVFYRGYKQQNPKSTDLEVSNAWHKMKVDENRQQIANRIITFSDLPVKAQSMVDKLVDQVHAGNMEPKAADNALRAFGTNAQGAFAERYTDKYGSFDQIQLQANADFFKNPANQRLIRQIGSTFEAMDEDKRLAKLVDNPAGTPLNKLKGAAQVALGNSQRAMFNMGNLASIDEFNRIMGGSGGAVQYFEELKEKIDPNMSVQQYLDVMNEAKYYLATRLKAYTEGTPLSKKMAGWYEEVKGNRPYLTDEERSQSKVKKNMTFNPATGAIE